MFRQLASSRSQVSGNRMKPFAVVCMPVKYSIVKDQTTSLLRRFHGFAPMTPKIIIPYRSDHLRFLRCVCCSPGLMVGLGRFELPTSPLSGVRSNQLSYRPIGPLPRRPNTTQPGARRLSQKKSHSVLKGFEDKVEHAERLRLP